ncbi:hypothetical protein Tco_0347251 [Tanacetum coccineum]
MTDAKERWKECHQIQIVGFTKADERFLSLLSQLEIHGAGSTASSSNLQNVAFVSENTNSTNDVSTAYGVSNTSGHNSKLDEQIIIFLACKSNSSCPQLD